MASPGLQIYIPGASSMRPYLNEIILIAFINCSFSPAVVIHVFLSSLKHSMDPIMIAEESQ